MNRLQKMNGGKDSAWRLQPEVSAHPYSKSISIIKMYSTNNVDS